MGEDAVARDPTAKNGKEIEMYKTNIPNDLLNTVERLRDGEKLS